ncbi:MAG: flagellum-specific ATP synthase FliI, partial [Alphaproteobacteria bacterium]
MRWALALSLRNIINEIDHLPDHDAYGRVAGIRGMLVEVGGLQGSVSVGDRIAVVARGEREVLCEIVGFHEGRALLMPFESLEGVGLGCRAVVAESGTSIFPDESWLGRVVDAMGPTNTFTPTVTETPTQTH